MIKEKKYFDKHDEIVNTHIPHGFEANASPHIVVNRWFHRIEKKCILLKLTEEEKYSKEQKIFYKVNEIGENIKLNIKKNFIKLNIEGTKNNKIFIVVKYEELMNIDRISFFTETGNVIESGNKTSNKKGYVILAAVQSEQVIRKSNINFTVDEVSLAKKYLRNQTQSSNKEYHFGTTGNIFGFGYGPVYSSNSETQYTIDRFAKSKFINLFFCFSYII